MNVEGTLTEIMVAYDWGSAKHCVQGLHEPEELLWLVVGKDGKSDFDKHTSLCSALDPSLIKWLSTSFNDRDGPGTSKSPRPARYLP
jgi:hypothetical protein